MSALSTVLLCAPVAYHRMVFRHHQRARLLHVANAMAVVGLITVALAISAAVVLVVSFVEHGVLVGAISAVTLLCFAGLWFALPMWGRRASDHNPYVPNG